MPESYSWDLVAEPFSGSFPDPGVYVPSVPTLGLNAKKTQFERGIKFANVPGGKAENVVHGGPRIWHVNSVQNLLQDPIDKSVVAGPGSYSGAVKYRGRSYRKNVKLLPDVASPSEGRNTDRFGHEQFFNSYSEAQRYGHILDSNTLALWRFDEITGSIAYDIASGSTHITAFGNIPVVTGQIDRARYQTGSANPSQVLHASVTGSLVLQMQNEWTIEAWVKPDITQTVGPVIVILNGLDFLIDPEDKIIAQFQMTDDFKLAATTWPTYLTNQFVTFSSSYVTPTYWNHVALSRISQNSQYRYKAYVNGILKDQSALFNPPAIVSGTGTHFFGVGSYITNGGLGAGDSLFRGGIDDVRVSKIARTDDEIYASYLRGAGSSTVPASVVIGQSSLLSGLAAYYKLDSSFADAAGGSDLTNNGTEIAWESGILGDCSRLQATDTWLSTGGIALGTSFSISAWINIPEQVLGLGTIASVNGSAAGLYANNAGGMVFSYYTGLTTLLSDISWAADTWTHVVFTYDGTTAKFYVNGDAAGSSVASIGSTTIGSIIGFDSGGLALGDGLGALDEVGMWTRPITQAEVTELYNAGSGLTHPFSS